jgi:hypothetical protein
LKPGNYRLFKAIEDGAMDAQIFCKLTYGNNFRFWAHCLIPPSNAAILGRYELHPVPIYKAYRTKQWVLAEKKKEYPAERVRSSRTLSSCVQIVF